MEMYRLIRALISFSPRIEVPVPIEQQAGWVTEPVWRLKEKRKHLLSLQETKPQNVGPASISLFLLLHKNINSCNWFVCMWNVFG